jgi:hypothetical protein
MNEGLANKEVAIQVEGLRGSGVQAREMQAYRRLVDFLNPELPNPET